MPAAPGRDSPCPFAIDPVDHLKWARGIARGARADYRFQSGSQEELELEATANLVLCEYAPRFDVRLAFTRAAAPHMSRAVLATPRAAPGPISPSGLATTIVVCGTDVTEWVRAAAHRLARNRTIGRAAAIEAAARAAIAVARVFDAGGAFRGWCRREVVSRCRREAARMKNGGTFHTKRNNSDFVFIKPLPKKRLACGIEEVPLATDGRRSGEPDPLDALIEREQREQGAVSDTTLDGRRPGECLETDGRRPPPAGPLDALIDSEGAAPPDNWRAMYDAPPEG